MFIEGLHLVHDALGFRNVSDRLTARRAKFRSYRRNHSSFAFVGVGQIAGVMDQFCSIANRTFHVQSSFWNNDQYVINKRQFQGSSEMASAFAPPRV
jgi:hypothetical protein